MANSTNDNSDSKFTFTIHLPGLKKTMQMSYKKIPISSSDILEFHNFITNTFNVVSRRARIFWFHKDKGPYAINWMPHDSELLNGDTFILCVRGTTVEGENEYYDTQKESLKLNKYLNPSISKNNAISLLISIAGGFESYGHKYYCPGGRWYEYQKQLDIELESYYNN
jgi:hypothetical protein